MVTSSEDGTVKIWETRSGTVQRSYSHGCPVNDVVIHPNQGEIISCDRGGSVRIWDLAENNCSHQLIPEEDISVSSVTVASDGSTLCAGTNSVSILFHCVEEWKCLNIRAYVEEWKRVEDWKGSRRAGGVKECWGFEACCIEFSLGSGRFFSSDSAVQVYWRV